MCTQAVKSLKRVRVARARAVNCVARDGAKYAKIRCFRSVCALCAGPGGRQSREALSTFLRKKSEADRRAEARRISELQTRLLHQHTVRYAPCLLARLAVCSLES